MSDPNLTRLQALIQNLLEDSVTFEEEALSEVSGRKILAFIEGGQRSIMAINDMYTLKLIDYLEGRGEYNLADMDYLADYITNKYPLRSKVRNFLEKVRQLLRD